MNSNHRAHNEPPKSFLDLFGATITLDGQEFSVVGFQGRYAVLENEDERQTTLTFDELEQIVKEQYN